jgi:galactokinase
MRDDYETSTAEIDTLVRISDAQPEVFGSRLTGGGFGGAVVIAARAGNARSVAERIRDAYRAETGGSATILVPAVDERHES